MRRVRLIHWDPGTARVTADLLREAGYRVDAKPFDAAAFRALKQSPPDAVVIDLGRVPSHGRDVALGIRRAKATRHVPLVFVEGDPSKVARIRKQIPDAVYAPWRTIRSSLKRAMASPPAEPVVPSSGLAGYSGTPLVKKLGIKVGSKVHLVGSPSGFEKTLGPLPSGAKTRRRSGGTLDLIIWFVRSRKELEDKIQRIAGTMGKDGMWIAWPKKASGVESDVDQTVVREVGLGNGLVDFKICSIDETWSGLKFTRRRKKP